MSSTSLVKSILFFSLLGLVIALYSLLHNSGFVSGSFCTLSETVNCDVVNKGAYSSIWGIPVALVGVLGYFFLAAGALLKLRQPTDRSLSLFLLIASVGGLAFSFYLTFLEAFVLHAWCALCVTSQLLILIIFIFSIALNQKKPTVL